jgi:hypothetical protein
MEGRTEIIRYRKIVPVDPTREVNVEFHTTINVAFGEGSPMMGVAVLPALFDCATSIREEVLPRLEPFLTL